MTDWEKLQSEILHEVYDACIKQDRKLWRSSEPHELQVNSNFSEEEISKGIKKLVEKDFIEELVDQEDLMITKKGKKFIKMAILKSIQEDD